MKIRLSWRKGRDVKTLQEKFRRYLWRSYLLRDKELDRIVLEAEVIDEGKIRVSESTKWTTYYPVSSWAVFYFSPKVTREENWVKRQVKTLLNKFLSSKKIAQAVKQAGIDEVGYTLKKAIGRYVSKEGEIYEEPSYVLEVGGLNYEQCLALAQKLGEIFDQSEVWIRYEGEDRPAEAPKWIAVSRES